MEMSFLPDLRQSMLVEAIFAEDQAFEQKCALWLAAIDLDQLDMGSTRLLPLLLDRIDAERADPALVARLRAVKRHSWAKNQRLIHFARMAADALAAAGVPVIALKGIGLATYHYANPALRPMDDIDLLVQQPLRERAVEVLARSGWTEKASSNRSIFVRNTKASHDFASASDPGILLDLHSRLFAFRFSEQATGHLWSRARPVAGSNLLMPCAADMLLHVCAHGARYNLLPPVRWLADGMMIVRREPVDWDYFVEQCAAWQVSWPVARCLEVMRSISTTSVPAEVIEALGQHGTDATYQRLYQIEQRDSPGIGDRLFLHRHNARNTNLSANGRPQYLRYVLGRVHHKGLDGVVERSSRVLGSLCRRPGTGDSL